LDDSVNLESLSTVCSFLYRSGENLLLTCFFRYTVLESLLLLSKSSNIIMDGSLFGNSVSLSLNVSFFGLKSLDTMLINVILPRDL
jgi:hypothetical protein